ncbi:MAG: AMP-binding protein [Candidatus Helarchaeota archaeon]
MTYENRPWIKNYDENVPKDIDLSKYEGSFVELSDPVFKDFPNRLAMHYLGVDFTFKQLDIAANKIANTLIKNGLKPGDVVAINMANCPQYIISHLGILRAGCVSSGLSPLLSEDEMEYQLKDSKAKGIITLDAVFEARLTKIYRKLPDLKVIIVTNIADYLSKIKQILGKLLGKIPKGKVKPLSGRKVIKFMDCVKGKNAYPSTRPDVKLDPESTSLLMYTGGTTGRPKGAVLLNRNIAANILQIGSWLQIERGKNVALSGFPFFHIAGLTFCAMCIYTGTSQILIPNPRDTNHICKEIEKFKPTMLVNVPTLYQMLMNNPKFKKLPFSQLNFAISAASPFPAESIRELESYIGKNKFIEVYGMTETSPLTIMNPRFGIKKIGSIGMPISNTDVKLVDPETGEIVPQGEAGEILVKGPQVMKEYLNKPDKTRETIEEDGFLHTGDVAIMDDDGYFSIVDRTKDMIIVGGFKVYSVHVEDVLAKHPDIELAALIGIKDPKRPGSEIVKAIIQLKEGKLATDEVQESIKAYAEENLSKYEKPKIWEFREELPLTAVGKVLKRQLRAE